MLRHRRGQSCEVFAELGKQVVDALFAVPAQRSHFLARRFLDVPRFDDPHLPFGSAGETVVADAAQYAGNGNRVQRPHHELVFGVILVLCGSGGARRAFNDVGRLESAWRAFENDFTGEKQRGVRLRTILWEKNSRACV